MPRRSKADRARAILHLNPALPADDPRIGELIAAEDMLKAAQRAAKGKPVLTQTAAGNERRSPVWVEVDKREEAVRRLRNQLGIDRVSVKQAEAAGLKVKRSKAASDIVARGFDDFVDNVEIIPGYVGFLAAHGITADDVPREHRERFESELAARVDEVPAIRSRLRQYGML